MLLNQFQVVQGTLCLSLVWNKENKIFHLFETRKTKSFTCLKQGKQNLMNQLFTKSTKTGFVRKNSDFNRKRNFDLKVFTCKDVLIYQENCTACRHPIRSVNAFLIGKVRRWRVVLSICFTNRRPKTFRHTALSLVGCVSKSFGLLFIIKHRETTHQRLYVPTLDNARFSTWNSARHSELVAHSGGTLFNFLQIVSRKAIFREVNFSDDRFARNNL